MSSRSRPCPKGLASPQRRPTVLGADFSPFSKSPSHLKEVTQDLNFSASCQSPVQGSPAQARTMKDYEEQLSSLKKENFSLKLNVYLLEERLYVSNTPAPQDNLLKKNIELKISLEGLRRDINEKQDLLCSAASALELMESSAARKEAELLSQISSMENELHLLRSAGLEINDDISVVPGINGDNTTMGVDDSVALYAAAFNLHPTPSEVEILQKKVSSKNEVTCECRQLKALLTIEKENASTLRDTVNNRDQIILEQKQQIQELEEKQKDGDKNNSINISERKSVGAVDTKGSDHQLERLQQENLNACQMIQGCLVRIKQMDRENKKLKRTLIQKDEVISKQQAEEATVDNVASVKKYKNMIDARDNKINDLEIQLKTLCALKEHNSSKMSSLSDDKEWNLVNSHIEHKINILRESICVNPGNALTNAESSDDTPKETNQLNIQDMLVRRLQELGYFLDSLLSHKCVLSDEKRRKVENLLEQTIELPLGLELDKHASQLLEETFMDSSFGKPSQMFRLDNLTTMFGHHASLNNTCDSHVNIKYKYLDDTHQRNESNLENTIKRQALEIQNLNNQMKNMKALCICENVTVENSDVNDSSGNLKSSCCEYNKLISRRSKLKPNRSNKICLNSTWNGFEGLLMDQSESECWSEPDRSVSLARMGGPLDDAIKEVVSSEDEIYSQRLINNSNILQKSLNVGNVNENKLSENRDQIKSLILERCEIETLLKEANSEIAQLKSSLETNKISYASEMKAKQDEINSLVKKLTETENSLTQHVADYTETVRQFDSERNAMKSELKSTNDKLVDITNTFIREQKQYEHEQSLLRRELKEISEASNIKIKEIQDKMESDWVSRVRYEALRRELDNAALQASQATLDRALATEHKVRSDAETDRFRAMLRDEQLRVSELENVNAELQNRLVRVETWHTSASRAMSSSGHASDASPQAGSPDHSIEGDRLSMMELIESVPSNEKFNPRDLAAENIILRERLERTQRALENTMNQLKNNRIPHKMQRAACQEIHKTHSLLRQVRDNLNS